MFCVGAMGLVGALQGGLSGSHDTLFTKALIDGIAAAIMASTLGAGVLLSGGLVFLYEGGVALAASLIAPWMTEPVIHEITCVGSLLIIGLSLNMLGLTRLKIMNYLPAVFLPILFCLFL